MDRTSLDELRRQWAEAVLLQQSTPVALASQTMPAPCWFGANLEVDDCEGRIEGAHWLKRQRVERFLADNLSSAPLLQQGNLWKILQIANKRGLGGMAAPNVANLVELIQLAAWDPRNGVPACEKHRRRFDAQRMPTLTVWRHQVPAQVEAFVLDWGLETALEDRNPAIGAGL